MAHRSSRTRLESKACPFARFRGVSDKKLFSHKINGLRFDGNGEWSSNPFVISNAGTVIGFSNDLIAVVANGDGTLIENCRFQGFGTFAVTLNGTQQTVINCTATNIGRAAFRSYR